ncbi:MAG: hypothetical protein IKQ11_04735 [Paludibacteraceae bacterium]|nr:hypothetical protein [Paludibacteraceae bacterium]
MKKVFFYAVLFAAASMTFVACGKSENKEAENEECCQGKENHECCKAKRAEQYVSAIEAAQTLEEAIALSEEYQDLVGYEFSEEQQARMAAAVAKLGAQ